MADISGTEERGGSCRRFKQRMGIVLCGIYALAYAGFVAVSIYDVTLMDAAMPFGLNLAVFYGLGLIALALLLGVVYSWSCYIKERNGAGE